MSVTPEQAHANAELVAAAIRSMTMANGITWAAVGQLLDKNGVATRGEFADLLVKIAKVVEAHPETSAADGFNAGATMLRDVHDFLRGINPPRWTPKVHEGGKGTPD